MKNIVKSAAVLLDKFDQVVRLQVHKTTFLEYFGALILSEGLPFFGVPRLKVTIQAFIFGTIQK